MKSEEGMAEIKGRMDTSMLLSQSSELVALRHPGRNSTLLPRGVTLPEEGNGDTAAMPTWEIQVLPQPLKVLWKHDTGRAALLSSLIQSLTNGSKEGEERGGHYKRLPKDFCSSSNPFVRNTSKCRHSRVYKQKDNQLSSGYFHPSNFPEGPCTFKGNKISSLPTGRRFICIIH